SSSRQGSHQVAQRLTNVGPFPSVSAKSTRESSPRQYVSTPDNASPPASSPPSSGTHDSNAACCLTDARSAPSCPGTFSARGSSATINASASAPAASAHFVAVVKSSSPAPADDHVRGP